MPAQLFRVVLPVTDLEAATRFYGGLLCMNGERYSSRWHCFHVGSVLLTCSTEPADPVKSPLFIATEEQLPQLQIRARQLGARRVDPQIRQLESGEKGFGLQDPFGNLLCLVETGTMRWSKPLRDSNAWGVAHTTQLVLPLEQDFLNAVKGGELSRVSELLAVDPDLMDVVDQSGVSVLMTAAYKRHEQLVSYLLPLRKALNVWEAAAFGHVDRLRAILRESPHLLRQPAADGYLPLGLACYFGQVTAMDFLVERGAPVNLASSNEMRAFPLHSALAQQPEHIALVSVQRLLKAGALPNVTQARGHTPLHQAAGRGLARVAELLLAAGADREVRADNGMTAADLARAAGHPSLAQRLERPKTAVF